MEPYPLFVIGAPRSGTTFLCSLLNAHPSIQLTNESRIFVLLKDMLDVRSGRPDLLGDFCRERFLAFARRNAGAWVERFYREGLGVTAPIWGDKHPPYGDPALLSGRVGSIMRLPRSGSCLRLITESLPNARFIHIHCNPGHVAHSLVRKGWVMSVEDGVRVWRQYLGEILTFLDELPAERSVSIAYRDLIEDAAPTVAALGRFLGLDDFAPIGDFLAAQRHAPTPFSDPVRDVADLYLVSPDRQVIDRDLAGLAGEVAAQLGYVA
jgi:Sulfotransferase family